MTTPQKYLCIDVPAYDGSSGHHPRSYIQLGAAPTSTPLKHGGDDLLQAVGLPASRFYRDDYRKENGWQHPGARYYRSDGETSSQSGDPSTLTQELLTRGGWREHTDGNRVTTTRGDRVDIIGGNYKLVVLGRRWQRTDDAGGYNGHGWGESYWEVSGGHIKDATNTPGEVVNIQWVGGEWRVVEETIHGNTISIYSGNQYETFKGREILSKVGDKTGGAIPKNRETTVQRQNPDNGWVIGASDTVDWQNPVIVDKVKAKAIVGRTEIFADGVGGGFRDSDETITNKTSETVVSGTWTSSTLAEIVIDSKGSGGKPIAKFKDNLYVKKSGGSITQHELYVVKLSLTCGGALVTSSGRGFKLAVSLSAGLTAAATADVWLPAFKFGFALAHKSVLEMGAGLALKVGTTGEIKTKKDWLGLTKSQAKLVELGTKIKADQVSAGQIRKAMIKFWL